MENSNVANDVNLSFLRASIWCCSMKSVWYNRIAVFYAYNLRADADHIVVRLGLRASSLSTTRPSVLMRALARHSRAVPRRTCATMRMRCSDGRPFGRVMVLADRTGRDSDRTVVEPRLHNPGTICIFR